MASHAIAPAPAAEDPADHELMLAYAAGDAAAFDALYARHRGGVYRYMLRHCGERALADELFQDVWMNVIRSRDSYAPTALFTTWLYRIAHNRIVDHWRSRGQHEEIHADGEDEAPFACLPGSRTLEPDVRAESGELAVRMQSALNALPPLQRDALLLQLEGGLAIAEIAALTNTGAETVKSRLRYASKRMRELLGDLG